MATRIRMNGRQLWFQVHKWIALILLVLLIPIALSGSLLVWAEWTDSMVNPQRYAVSESNARLPAERYVTAARAVLRPGERIASIDFPADAGRPVVLTAAPAHAETGRRGPPLRHQLWLDPASARVLDSASTSSGFLRFMHVLHGSLLVPGIGRTIVGWLGVAMLILSLTGLWLWLPTSGKLSRGLRWRRGDAVSHNLHHQIGFWVALPLAILSFTGVWISFPGLFQGSAEGPPGARGGGRGFPAPVEAARRSSDSVLGLAREQSRGAPAVSLRWPTEQDGKWTVVVEEAGVRRSLSVDDANASVAPASDRGRGQRGLMRVLHDGTGTGPVWQTIIFIVGLAPAVLGVTGVIMWLRTRRWRSPVRQRQARNRSAA